MASAIDSTKPVEGTPTTKSVRDNFAAAKSEIEELQTLKQDIEQGAWQEITLLNGWANYGGGYENAAYRVETNGTIRLRGMIKDGTIGQTIGVLPSAARPVSMKYLPGATSNAAGLFFIDVSGNMIPQSGSPTWFSLDGIVFNLT